MNKLTIEPIHSWYTEPETSKFKQDKFISEPIISFYHSDYIPGNHNRRKTIGTVENIINTLKNQFKDQRDNVLIEAKNNLIQILKTDLPQILKETRQNILTVCVIPRAKTERNYSSNQLYFKQSIKEVVTQLNCYIDGSEYIIRQSNTRTTHMDRSGYGGDGDLPYPGITKKTCYISNNVKDKDILLIDDLYTEGVSIDEDAIQALLDNGARNVYFYGIGRTKKGIKKASYEVNEVLPF